MSVSLRRADRSLLPGIVEFSVDVLPERGEQLFEFVAVPAAEMQICHKVFHDLRLAARVLLIRWRSACYA